MLYFSALSMLKYSIWWLSVRPLGNSVHRGVFPYTLPREQEVYWIIQGVFSHWYPPKNSKCQLVSKFWHLELFWWDLLCNLTLRTFRGVPVKKNTLYIYASLFEQLVDLSIFLLWTWFVEHPTFLMWRLLSIQLVSYVTT